MHCLRICNALDRIDQVVDSTWGMYKVKFPQCYSHSCMSSALIEGETKVVECGQVSTVMPLKISIG